MKPSTLPRLTLFLIGMLTITACGVDRGGAPDPGVDRGGFVIGPISGFGSLIVNGVAFDTSQATILVDGEIGSEADLAVGQIVAVSGPISADGLSGTAENVTFEDNVEGPIAAIDVVASTLTVLGQTVIVDDATSFNGGIDPAALEGLQIDNVVEVSGFVNADGNIFATRIKLKDGGGEFEVTGIVQGLDVALLQFAIGALTVDYSAAMLEDFPGGEPRNGDRVEAKGMNFGPAGEFLATKVEFKDTDIPAQEGDEVEIEGFVTRFTSATDFDVSNQAVTTNAGTEFEEGTASDLGVNVKIEVEGELNGAGVLVADKVKFKRSGVIRIEASVEAIDQNSQMLTALGIDVRVDNSTRMEDKSASAVQQFSLVDVNINDFLKIRGFEEPPGSHMITATRVERVNPEATVKLKGFVESLNEPDFVILGVTIQTDAGTTFERDDVGPITAAEFFMQANGQLVSTDGVLNGEVIVADEVEIDDADSDK